MLVLGIETSCDETSISVASEEKGILSNVVVSSLHFHKKYGGVVPEIACRHHTELINFVLDKALKKAKVSLSDLDAISVTQGPGLIGALLVGISLAKSLSYSLNIPLIPVNHLHAHIYAATINKKVCNFPAIGLIVSGGHTSLVCVKNIYDIKLLGQTRDDACGEAFDKVAKILGLGFPGGPVIEQLAEKGDSKKIDFPRTYLEKNSYDFSFSGIKTAVLYYVQKIKKANKRLLINDICASFQQAMFDMLLKKTRCCCENNNAKTLLVGGGVSASKKLQNLLDELGKELDMDVLFPPEGLSMDNGAMIAALGVELYKKKKFGSFDFSAKSNLNF